MITKQDLRQENGLEDFFSQHIVSARIAAAKGKERLGSYRPDPTTGKQAPGTIIKFGLAVLDERISMMKGCYYLVAARARVGKCLGKGTPVLMYDGSIRAVEDVGVGDLLMGDDSTPRTVLALGRGRAQMYWIRQNKAMDYRVNDEHILCLKRSWTERSHEKGDILEIKTEDAFRQIKNLSKRYKGYRVAVDWDEKELPLEPYFLGLWLGDGHTASSKITVGDDEIRDYLEGYAERLGHTLTLYPERGNCDTFAISTQVRGGHTDRLSSVQATLRKMGVLGNKHIPQQYMASSRQQRLSLLAGIIDSDGHLGRGITYEVTMKNEGLIRQIAMLANTLGFRATVKSRMAQAQSGPPTQVWRVHISGDFRDVPCLLKRKRSAGNSNRVNQTTTGISIEPDCVDDYYGFEVDGNGRFLLGDCTVTHNTAMGMQIADNAMRQLQGTGKQVAIFSAEMDAASLTLREACAIERINYWDMVKGRLSQEQYDALALRLDEIAESGYWLDETPAPTIEHMIVQLEALAAGEKGIGMVLFDYLELAGDSERDEVKRIAKISRGLKAIAKRFDCPVLALGQLNRDIDRRAEKKPSLADLMYGGEREPDGIVILHRPDLYDDSTPKIKDKDGKDRLIVEAHIVKHRHGPGGDVTLAFDPDTMRFDSAIRNRVPLNQED